MPKHKGKIWRNLFISAFLLGAGFVTGVLFQRDISLHAVLLKLGIRHSLAVPSDNPEIALTPNADKIFTDDEPNFVGLVLGQSNAASYGATSADASENVFQFWRGKYYAAKDPLFGSSGNGGSIWMYMNQHLLQDFSNVLWASTAIEQTSISAWLPESGQFYHYLHDTLAAIEDSSLPVDAIFWVQGESDAQTGVTEERYYESLSQLIALLQTKIPDTPIYLAKATRCRQYGSYEPIRKAIDRIVEDVSEAKAGIDLDQFGLEYRFDGCHLSEQGLQRAALEGYELLPHNNSQ